MADMSRRRMNGGSGDSRKRKLEQFQSNGDADDDSTSNDYPCHYCSAVFVTQISLSRHVLTFHDGQKQQQSSFANGNDEEEEEEEEEGEQQGQTFEDAVAANGGYYENDEDEEDEGQGYTYETVNENGEVGEFDISQFLETEAVSNDNEQGVNMGYSDYSNDGNQSQSQTMSTGNMSDGSGVPSMQRNNPKPKLSPEVLANVLAQVEEITAAATGDFVTCPLCRKTFGRKELSIHVSCEHGGAKFTCPYCGRTISRRDHLKRHIQNVHPEMCTENEIGPFPRNLNLCRSNNAQKKTNNTSNGTIIKIEHQPQQQQTQMKSLPISIMTPRVQMDAEEDDEEDDFEGEEMQQEDQSQNNSYYTTEYREDEEDGQEDSMQITVEPELPFQNLQDYNDDDEDDEEYDASPSQYMDSTSQYQQQKQMGGSSLLEIAEETIAKMAYQCSLCNAVFSSKVLLDRHESTHSELRPHKCSLCGKGFLRKEHLSKHLSSVHSGMKFTCEFCGKDISRKDHLIRHIRNVHPNQFYALPQDGDQELSSQPPHVQTVAIKTVQSLQPRPKKPFFSCDMCEATFINIDDLHIHQSTVHSDVRKYKCNYCAKAFKRKEHLTKHEVLHTGERKFACRVCGSEFQRKEYLQDHIRRVHGINANNVTVNGSNGSAISTIPCNLCDQLFQDRGTLLSHMTTSHGLIVNSPPGLPKNSPQNQIQSQLKTQLSNGQSTRPSLSTKNLAQKSIPALNGNNLGSLMDLINKGSITLSFHPIKQE